MAAVLTAVAIPETLASIDASRALAAARYVSARAALARMQAVTRSAAVALRIDRDAGGFRVASYADGNYNGVRTRDIESGVDRLVDPPVRLFELFPGVDFALVIDGVAGDPIQLGSSALLSFTATGTSTSGSVYVRGRDGSQYVVRVIGVTGRTRLLHYDPSRAQWVPQF